jgi:hypothetical protein
MERCRTRLNTSPIPSTLPLGVLSGSSGGCDRMKVTGLGWMGTKTRQFDSMITFYRDVLNLGA